MTELRHWLFAFASLALFTLPASAAVFQYGDVTPYDFPSTINNEGIVDFSYRQSPPELFEHPDPIIIGETTYGLVRITAGTELRYQDLVLGGSEQTGSMGGGITGSTTGTGIFILEGFGTLFNNDPNSVPLGAPEDPTPRQGNNFNTYVGATGSGSLQVSAGARMELGGALFVGLADGSYGEVLVDGFASHINVGGTDDDMGGVVNPLASTRATLIGPLGVGVMTIQNGGSVDSRGGAAIGAFDPEGADELTGDVGGSISLDPEFPQPNGYVTVTGLGSQWRIAGGLAIGMYDGTGQYETNFGAGSLTIADRAIVTVDEIPDGLNTDEEPGAVYIGRFGELLLDNGTFLAEDAIISHGNIEGHGTISATTFVNRPISGGGQVIVREGQTLRINSFGETADTVGGEAYFGANTGIIEVTGGEFVFNRPYDPTQPDTRFKNLFLPETPDDPMTVENEFQQEENGTIVVRNGTVRFNSGLANSAVLGFTSGNNLLTGDLLNEVGGQIVVSGDSNTTFANDLTNDGQLLVSQDSTLTVLGDISLSQTASLTLALSNGEPFTNLPQGYLAAGGDIALGGLLDVNAPLGGNFNPTPGDSFLLMSTTGTITGIFDVLDFAGILPLANPGWSWLLENTGQQLLLSVTDIMPIGADFNGDGIVDEADIAIWQMNFGIDMGATGLQGDADGDGDVDAVDFFIIQQQLGGPGMGALAGSPLGPGGTVPEPHSLALLLGGVLAAAFARRYRR
jgi:T5SS/PEP-CTERM-associated repeat protein